MAWKDSFLAIVLATWFMENGLAIQNKPQRLTVKALQFGKEVYSAIPTSTYHKGIAEYVKVPQDEDNSQAWDLYSLPNDPRWVLIYDLNGIIAGVQISYVLARRPSDKYFSSRNFIDNIIHDIPVKSVPIFFTNPEDLRVTSRNRSSTDIVEGLWAKLDGKWVRYGSKWQPNSPILGENFYMQGCVPRYGQIYVRELHETDKCEDIFYLNLMYEDRKLVGFGFTVPGVIYPGPKNNIYHSPDETLVQATFQNPPPCFSELSQYGFTTVSLFLIEDPWHIRCPKCYCK